MKVVLDGPACVGHGRCNFTAPEIFELDDLGYCSTTEVEVPADQEAAALAGADSCPERAISVT